MNWLVAIWTRRAVTRLARVLPRELAEGWGGSRCYTPHQVRAALTSLKVKGRVRAYGFAAFLEQDVYDELADPIDHAVPYLQARRTFFEAARVTPGAYAFEPAPDDYSSSLAPSDFGHSGHDGDFGHHG